MSKEIILINDSLSANKLLEDYKPTSNKSIITFNFITHVDLKKKKIPHKLVEDYLDKKDAKLIDETTRNIVFSWYENSEIKKLISFKGLNLGWLLENELFG